jgi:hypothetical protein
MKHIVVIFTLALLFISTGKSQAGCYGRYYHYGPHPVVVCHRVYHRAWIPGYWRWDWSCHRYFWVYGYWY